MSQGGAEQATALTIGRYALFGELAAGGMATVHIGRLQGTAGFKRTVAIKRLHAQFARDPEFVAAFLDEAQLVARIQHPNVVPVLDVVAEAGELFMVMEYVHGESLSNLLRAARAKGVMPNPVVIAQIVTGLLYGLDAAHQAKSDRGVSLHIVHRDVSPQNILVGLDGVARVLDFGVAKAAQKVQETTKEGVVKGKVAYMAPEQLNSENVIDGRVDVYAAGVVLWEALTGTRLYDNADLGAMVARIFTVEAPPPSSLVPGLPAGLDSVVARALAKDRNDRYATALEMAHALERVVPPVAPREVGEWVKSLADERLRHRADLISTTEKISLPPPPDGRSSIAEIIEEGKRASRPDLNRAQTPSAPFGPVSSPQASADGPTSTQVLFDVPARPAPSGASAKHAGVVLAILALVGVIGVVLVLVVARQGKGRSAHASPGPSASAPMPAASAEPPPQSFEIIEVPATAAPAPSASSSAAASSASAAPPASAASSASRPAVAAPAPRRAPKRNCDPPWTIDASGVRVIKRECL